MLAPSVRQQALAALLDEARFEILGIGRLIGHDELRGVLDVPAECGHRTGVAEQDARLARRCL